MIVLLLVYFSLYGLVNKDGYKTACDSRNGRKIVQTASVYSGEASGNPLPSPTLSSGGAVSTSPIVCIHQRVDSNLQCQRDRNNSWYGDQRHGECFAGNWATSAGARRIIMVISRRHRQLPFVFISSDRRPFGQSLTITRQNAEHYVIRPPFIQPSDVTRRLFGNSIRCRAEELAS